MNKTLVSIFMTVLFAVILSSCATKTKYQPVRIEGDAGTLSILRIGTKPNLVSTRISIDDQFVGSLKNGEVLNVPVHPGRRIVKLHFNKILFMKSKTLPVTITPGQAHHFEIDSQFSIYNQVGAGLQSEWEFFLIPATPKAASFCCDEIEPSPDYLASLSEGP